MREVVPNKKQGKNHSVEDVLELSLNKRKAKRIRNHWNHFFGLVYSQEPELSQEKNAKVLMKTNWENVLILMMLAA